MDLPIDILMSNISSPPYKEAEGRKIEIEIPSARMLPMNSFSTFSLGLKLFAILKRGF